MNDEKNGKLYAEYKKLAEKHMASGDRLSEYKNYDIGQVIAVALEKTSILISKISKSGFPILPNRKSYVRILRKDGVMGILITNIQRFSLHDGPGIRTTVFLKGCSLRCPWCNNPENLTPRPQNYIKDGLAGTYGKYYTQDELAAECLKDKNFYEGKINTPDLWPITTAEQIEQLPGGVTFSGGEALLQVSELVPVCEVLHAVGVHIAVETCLFVPCENLESALEHIDFFYVDMKILNAARCREVEHGKLDIYLSNLDKLMSWTDETDKYKPVVIRIPVIGYYTDGDENRRAVRELISKYQKTILKIELIKEHNLGGSKYHSLNMKMDFHGVEDGIMEQYKDELSDLNIPIEICKI